MEIKVRDIGSMPEKSVSELEEEVINSVSNENDENITKDDDSDGSESSSTVVENEGESEGLIKMSEADVLSFFEDKYGYKAESIDSIINPKSVKSDIPEDVQKFLDFKKETGRGLEDFYKVQKDVNSMGEDVLLREYISSQNPEYDEDDIDTVLSSFSFDEDLDDEMDIKKAKVAKKDMVSKAKKWFNSQKEKYSAPLESSVLGLSDEEKAEFEEFRKQKQNAVESQSDIQRKREKFTQEMDKVFSSDFKGFDFKVSLNGEEKSFSYKPGSSEDLKKANSSPMNMISKFLEQDGTIKDAYGYHKALSVGMNPEKFAQFFFEQGVASAIEDYDKSTKNISMSERSKPTGSTSKGDFRVKPVTSGDNPDRLKIRVRK
jgi:hypothetical protein